MNFNSMSEMLEGGSAVALVETRQIRKRGGSRGNRCRRVGDRSAPFGGRFFEPVVTGVE
jgi:hypothetical protein